MKKKGQLTDLVLTEANNENLVEDQHFFQVDFLKAMMIFLVIFDHIVNWDVKNNIGATLWERISIPIFLILLGFNASKSFQRKGDLSLKELYSWKYFKSKIARYVIPFLVLYVASTGIGLILYNFDFAAMYDGQFYPNHGIMNYFIGILPFWGPGNWFIPLLLQSILIMPLLYYAFKKKPIFALILCFIIEIAMQLTVFFLIGNITSWSEIHILNMFMDSIPFYLSGVGLGMWFSFEHRLEHSRNFFMWLLYPISLAFIVAFQFYGFQIMIGNIPLLRGDYHFLIFPYSAFLFLLAIKFLPRKADGPISRAISLIGKSTYHILLTQILGYGLIYASFGTHYYITSGFSLLDASYLIYAWLVFIPLGIIWYIIDQNKNLARRLLYYVNFFLIMAIMVFTIFVARGDWVPISIVFILIYAVIALILILIRRPLSTRFIALWTSFLVYLFFVTLLYMGMIEPTEFLIQNLSISVFFIIAVIGTVLDYTFRN